MGSNDPVSYRSRGFLSYSERMIDEFLRAALIPRDQSHAAGTLDTADGPLRASPDLRDADIFAAAVLGDYARVSAFVRSDPATAVSRGGPYGWDVLTHLCFSRYLQQRPDSGDFVECARLLLDNGAAANTGFREEEHEPRPTWESV